MLPDVQAMQALDVYRGSSGPRVCYFGAFLVVYAAGRSIGLGVLIVGTARTPTVPNDISLDNPGERGSVRDLL
jgi:hypothetical protein